MASGGVASREIHVRTQAEKGETFEALHCRPGCFVIPNPWDAGGARMLASLGFEALATTSAGLAFSLGRPDAEGAVSRDEAIANAGAIAAATDLPVSVDLEGGFGDAPAVVAETIRLAAQAGAVGGSIEDATGRPSDPIYDLESAVERVRAAVEAARSLPYRFVVTARAENFLYGRPDLDATIRRLQAFSAVGADVLYAPGLTTAAQIAAVVRAVDRPVNVLAGLGAEPLTVAQLAELGVKRISVGGALARAAYGAAIEGAREILTSGSFAFAKNAISFREIVEILRTFAAK